MTDENDVPAQPAAAPARPKLGGFKRPAFVPPSFVGGAKPANLPGGAVKKPALGGGALKKPALGGGARPVAAAASRTIVTAAPAAAAQAKSGDSRYFNVLYCKYEPRKKQRHNKKFSDGVLEVAVETKKAILMSAEGSQVSAALLRGVDVGGMGAGSNIVINNWEVEVEEAMGADKFESGEAFLKPNADAVAAALLAAPSARFLASAGGAAGGVGGAFRKPGGLGGGGLGGAAGAVAATVAAAPKALHDPEAEGAVVLNAAQWAGGGGQLAPGRLVSPVVVDPFMARHLRPHQVEGVRFLYDTTMGLRAPGMHGCILADEMGLGKTLQVLALVWTLLKQGPEGRPVVRKALIVTPSSLCQNWADEARKWLGVERLRVMVLSPGAEAKQQVVDFKHGSVHRVLVTSYETLRKFSAELAGVCDLLVCDEGHRLKSAQGNKTISALTALNCRRRVLLTGTPIQNDLTEFYAMANFVNPDSLGSLAIFEKVMAGPINRSRDRNATDKERELGATRSAELSRRVEQFVLRRTREVNARYLPPLSSYVVFCRPTERQLQRYSHVLGSGSVRRLLSVAGSDLGDQALSVLTMLRKICNHPCLHSPAAAEEGAALEGGGGQAEEQAEFDPDQSGKFAALSVLLQASLGAGDRMVVVSQSTAALDLVQKLCDARGWGTVRIDGGTDVSKRQDVVHSFNKYNVGQVFLLSTTAGGAGLNLTGANRLVLLDSHWNPAMDLQAMARVWRDGQQKPCVIYRLLLTGTVDEKMYQRQLKKNDMAATMMGGGGAGGAKAGGKQAGGKFSNEELAQLFRLRTNIACDTADILQQALGKARAGAMAAGSGALRRGAAAAAAAAAAAGPDVEADPAVAAAAAAVADFKDVSVGCLDAPLCAAIEAGLITFVHQDKTQAVAAVVAAVKPEEAGGSGDVGGSEGSPQQQQQQQQQQVPAEQQQVPAEQQQVPAVHQLVQDDGSEELEVDMGI